MGVIYHKVYWTSKDTGVEEDISGVVDASVLRALESKATTATLRFKNSYLAGSTSRKYTSTGNNWLRMKCGDSIMAYVNRDAAIDRDDPTHLLISGKIKEVSQSYEEDGIILEAGVIDKTYLLLSSIPAKRSWKQQTPPQIIRDVVRSVTRNPDGEFTLNDKKGNPQHYDVSVNFDTDSGYIETTHPLGGAFYPQDYAASLQSAYEIVREISGSEYCQTTPSAPGATPSPSPRSFIFYIDNKNYFHWIYPADSADHTPTDLTVYSEEFSDDAFDVVNMYIFDCGEDLRNYHVYWYLFNEADAGGDLRMKFIPMTDIAKKMKENEKERFSEYGILDADDDGFPDNYPYTSSWGSQVTDDDEYYDSFRFRAMIEGEKVARGFFKYSGEAKLKGEIELKGTTLYKVGEAIAPTFPAFGLRASEAGTAPELLRIKEINHTIGKEGWFTKLLLEQDESLYMGV